MREFVVLIKNCWIVNFRKYLPFILFSVAVFFFHFFVKFNGDDLYFGVVLNSNNIFDWLGFRYNNWTSRLFIEFFLVIVSNMPILWIILDTFILTLGAIVIYKLLPDKKFASMGWVICGLIACFPVGVHNSAGFITTTMNYSWVVVLGMLPMVGVKKILLREVIVWYEYIAYVFALIYAVNQEQMCVVLLLFYLTFLIYILYRDKKVNWFLLFGFLFSALSCVFIVTCPGNFVRRASEVNTWFPDFDSIGFFQKLEVGYFSTWFEFIMKPNFVFLAFSTALSLCVFLERKKWFLTFVSFVPLASSILFGFFAEEVGKFFPALAEISFTLTQYRTSPSCEFNKWLLGILVFLIFLSIVVSLYFLFDDKKMSWFLIFIIFLGFGSRMVMSFSPTIWASSVRTYIFMYMSFVFCTSYLYNTLRNNLVNRPLARSLFAT